MPADHARKGPVRRRQATTGESYTEAAKSLRRSYSRAVWDPWVAPRCEVADLIPEHDPWFSGPCPEGCPTRERPDYIAYLETLPPKARLPRPVHEREPYVCPGPSACTDSCCGCNDTPLTICPVCDAVYDSGFDVPCSNCERRAE
ncbi:hypothetical protein [Streptomyces erythrochromogenes]|uniref:hypothetical protein n=1 Tax=Streptomyces erythrochromogenes TaxID=285574 RepID=UPI003829C8FB